MRTRLTLILIICIGLFILVVGAFGSGVHSTDSFDCLKCHSEQIDQSYGHFIETSADCIYCHELSPDRSSMTTMTNDQVCRVCHVTHSESVKGGAHVDLSCTDCHEAHGSANPHLYRTQETSLCLGACHGDHDLGLSHPTGEQVTDLRLGTAMSCVSTCHSMHQPQEPKMLQMVALDLCAQCHGDKF